MLSSTGLLVTALDKAFNIGKYQLVVAGVLLTLTAIKQPDGIAASPPPPLVKLGELAGPAAVVAAAAGGRTAARPPRSSRDRRARPRGPVGRRPRRRPSAFYGRALGFERRGRVRAAGDGIRGADAAAAERRTAGAVRAPGSPAPGCAPESPIAALATRGYGHFAVSAPDIDALFARALEAGAGEKVSPRPSPEPGVRFAFVADPEGNLVELVERRERALWSR